MKTFGTSYTLRTEQYDATLICLSAVENLERNLSSWRKEWVCFTISCTLSFTNWRAHSKWVIFPPVQSDPVDEDTSMRNIVTVYCANLTEWLCWRKEYLRLLFLLAWLWKWLKRTRLKYWITWSLEFPRGLSQSCCLISESQWAAFITRQIRDSSSIQSKLNQVALQISNVGAFAG
jgi:hypothetical protein